MSHIHSSSSSVCGRTRGAYQRNNKGTYVITQKSQVRQRLKICIYNLNLCDPTFPNTLRQKAFFPLINNALKVKVQGARRRSWDRWRGNLATVEGTGTVIPGPVKDHGIKTIQVIRVKLLYCLVFLFSPKNGVHKLCICLKLHIYETSMKSNAKIAAATRGKIAMKEPCVVSPEFVVQAFGLSPEMNIFMSWGLGNSKLTLHN